MKISVDEARQFFAHPSQQSGGLTPDTLPETLTYYADGPICGAFHLYLNPGVYMAHYGVKPEGWGRLEAPAKRILNEAWADLNPERFIGWTNKSNRAAIAFSKRLGFVVDGELPLRNSTYLLQGWTHGH